MLETVLRLLPLSIGWEDSTSIMSVSVSGELDAAGAARVIGEDRVRVPAGTFDCWVVSVRADPARGMYWVTKTRPDRRALGDRRARLWEARNWSAR